MPSFLLCLIPHLSVLVMIYYTKRKQKCYKKKIKNFPPFPTFCLYIILASGKCSPPPGFPEMISVKDKKNPPPFSRRGTTNLKLSGILTHNFTNEHCQADKLLTPFHLNIHIQHKQHILHHCKALQKVCPYH